MTDTAKATPLSYRVGHGPATVAAAEEWAAGVLKERIASFSAVPAIVGDGKEYTKSEAEWLASIYTDAAKLAASGTYAESPYPPQTIQGKIWEGGRARGQWKFWEIRDELDKKTAAGVTT